MRHGKVKNSIVEIPYYEVNHIAIKGKEGMLVTYNSVVLMFLLSFLEDIHFPA